VARDRALLDSLVGHAPVGFAFIDASLRLRRVSQALAEMIGVKQAGQVGFTPAQAWPPVLAARAEAVLGRAVAGRPVQDGDVPEVVEVRPGAPGPAPAGAAPGGGPPDGGVSRLALSWHPARGAGGQLAGVTMIAVDVSAQHHAAELLRQAQERYRALVQAGNQVVWVTGPSGEVSEDSPEWRWVTGQSLDEYLEGGWLAAVHPDDRERVERGWRDCLQAGAVFDASCRIRAKTGSYRHHEMRAVPIERDGQIAGWLGASTDVTGQREADEMRGRLTAQLSAAVLRTSRLQQMTSTLAKELSVRHVLQVITEVGQSAIGADRAAVGIVSADRLRLQVMTTAPGAGGVMEELSGEIPLDSPGVLTAAIRARRPLVLESPESLLRQVGGDADALLRGGDERAWVGLPLITSGEPLGALQFSFARPRPVTDEERAFLEALAGQCALALERAMLYEREHATAETLQRSLLPDSLPAVPGIALTARYRPLSIEVGGDWYDAFRLPDGKLAVAAGDVMGKGLAAAAGMGRVRNALRALALTDPRPAAVLAGLDRLFIATERDEQVTTVCYLVVDPATGEGEAGNAGHLPPLLLGGGQPPRLDEAEPGTPLGWASPRRQYPFDLPPGSTAVLYSDGLVENRKRGLDAGLAELVSVAAQAAPEIAGDPDLLVDFLVERMLAGYEQDDDVTVLVVQAPGRQAGAAGAARLPARVPRARRPGSPAGHGRG